MMETAWRVDMRGMTFRSVATTCSIGVKSSLCRITLYGGSCVTRRSIFIPGFVSVEEAVGLVGALCDVSASRTIISGSPYRSPRQNTATSPDSQPSRPLPEERQDLPEPPLATPPGPPTPPPPQNPATSPDSQPSRPLPDERHDLLEHPLGRALVALGALSAPAPGRRTGRGARVA